MTTDKAIEKRNLLQKFIGKPVRVPLARGRDETATLLALDPLPCSTLCTVRWSNGVANTYYQSEVEQVTAFDGLPKSNLLEDIELRLRQMQSLGEAPGHVAQCILDLVKAEPRSTECRDVNGVEIMEGDTVVTGRGYKLADYDEMRDNRFNR